MPERIQDGPHGVEVKTTCSRLKINMPQPVKIEFD